MELLKQLNLNFYIEYILIGYIYDFFMPIMLFTFPLY